MERFWIIIAVGAGGAIGSIGRYAVSVVMEPRVGQENRWWATMTVNIAGCLLIGLLYTLFARKLPSQSLLKLGLVTGLLGGLTTFSTFSLESLILLEEERWMHAGVYIGGSLLLGLGATLGGVVLGRMIWT